MHGSAEHDAQPQRRRTLGRHPLVARTARALRLRCGMRPGARIVVGLSGGGDSVALSQLLTLLAHRSRGALPVAVHVHHHLRGAEADADADHAEAVARALGLPFILRDIHPRVLPGNLAASARKLRLDALADVARDLSADAVATAHHADDQLETMLMRLARGTGPDGLRGLRWRRCLAPGIVLIRPLLEVRREALEAFAAEAGWTWRDDPTNHDRETLRGRLRSDLTNRIVRLWPDAPRHATEAATTADIARRLLHRQVVRRFGARTNQTWPRAELRRMNGGLLTAGLRRAAIAASPEGGRRLSFAHLDRATEIIRAEQTHPRTLVWPRGLRLCVTAQQVTLTISTPEEAARHVHP